MTIRLFCGAVVALALASPALAQRPAVAKATTLEPYRINPGDDLDIFVWGEERLQRSVRVLPDGTFSFPLVGRVDAMNALPSEIEARITKGLEAQYRTAVPQVTVSVKTAAGLQFSMLGKVGNPGSLNPGRYVNILEAFSLAGGPAPFAQLNNVVIVRKTPTGTETIRVRMSDMLKGEIPAGGIPMIRGGDTVIVP